MRGLANIQGLEISPVKAVTTSAYIGGPPRAQFTGLVDTASRGPGLTQSYLIGGNEYRRRQLAELTTLRHEIESCRHAHG